MRLGLYKMVKARDPGARLKKVKVAHLPNPYLPPVRHTISSVSVETCFMLTKLPSTVKSHSLQQLSTTVWVVVVYNNC